MKIEIVDNSEIEGTKHIIINKCYHTITNETFNDYGDLGQQIVIHYNKQLPLDHSKYDEIIKIFKHLVGINKFGEVTLDVSIWNKNNIILIHCSRIIQCESAGGFLIEQPPDYILYKKDEILDDINNLKKLTDLEVGYLGL